MKKLKFLYLFLFSTLIISCNPDSKETGSNETIQTESGLQYYYVQHGEGRKVETGSIVGTILSLKVDDNVVWTSYAEKDSLFSFIANVDRVIEGFNEIVMLLREGDEVVAILPDSIAYGDKGAGSLIPPNATLTYDVLKIVTVGEPKSVLSDTLYATYNREGLVAALEKYTEVGNDTSNFHTGSYEVIKFWDRLTADGMHQDALELTANFNNILDLQYYGLLSMENMGQFQRALDSLNIMMDENPGIPEFQSFKERLEGQLTD